MANAVQSQVSSGFNVSFPANLVAFAEEILNGKLPIFCSESLVVINILLAVNDFKYHVLFCTSYRWWRHASCDFRIHRYSSCWVNEKNVRGKNIKLNEITASNRFKEMPLLKLPFMLPSYIFGHVAEWLTTCAWKAKVPGFSPAASYAQRWAHCSNRMPNVWVLAKRVEMVEKSWNIASLF